MRKYITLEEIKAHYPCNKGWRRLRSAVKRRSKLASVRDVPLQSRVKLSFIAKSNSVDDAVWCMRVAHNVAPHFRTYAIWCALEVASLTGDPKVAAFLKKARRRIAKGTTLTEEEECKWAGYCEQLSSTQLPGEVRSSAGYAYMAAEFALRACGPPIFAKHGSAIGSYVYSAYKTAAYADYAPAFVAKRDAEFLRVLKEFEQR
jgi:hypothetical protein